ncbi:MAG: hypothetical protein ACD_26C00088G0001 [uncultured bacterium]|nr:MAG: hypothetical protein ACD_26C00088G0001 [uncultured bacterium]
MNGIPDNQAWDLENLEARKASAEYLEKCEQAKTITREIFTNTNEYTEEEENLTIEGICSFLDLFTADFCTGNPFEGI